MVANARLGDSYETGNADLAFQNVLADLTSMRISPLLLHDLNKQLRIYIAVLGLTYVFSIDHMVRDDIEIFNAVAKHDFGAAEVAWNRKIDESMAYMSAQVSRRRN